MSTATAKQRGAMLHLYEYVEDMQTVLDWLAEYEGEIRAAGGEIPPELDELMEQVEGDLTEKVKRVGLTIRNLKANAAAAKSEADRLAATARSYERQADGLSEYLHYQLQRVGRDRVETPLVKVRIQRASRPAIRPVGEIPEAFRRVIPEQVQLDSAKAYEHVKPMLGKDAPDSFEVDGLRVEYSSGVRVW
ncbi:MAG TPA: siphovirus Gp157 family protein [Longimicrobiales bacterium]|nr:siphovirus Gp157 family protein [Longimicrobiales bacterium]